MSFCTYSVLGRWFVTDAFLIKKGEKKRRVFVRSSGEIVLDAGEEAPTVLFRGVDDDFDVCAHENGTIDIFCVSQTGALLHIHFSDDGTKVSTVIESRTHEGRISSVRAFAINGRFHLFYCLNRLEKLLVHHIVQAGSYAVIPEVVAPIGDKCIYDALSDASGDIHILLQSKEKHLVLKKFVYSSKSYLPPKKLLEREVRSLCLNASGERLFAAYVSPENGRHSVMLCDISEQSELVVSRGVSARSLVALVPAEDGLCVQWTENSMCFESTCSEDGVHVKTLGNTAGMARLRVIGGECIADRGAVNISGSFFKEADLVRWKREKNTFVPKGYDVDELSRRYIETLGRKNEFEDFGRVLSGIESNLEKLVSLVETALEEVTPKNNGEYNMEESYKEE